MKRNVRKGTQLPFKNVPIFFPIVVGEDTTPADLAKQVSDEIDGIRKNSVTKEDQEKASKELEKSITEAIEKKIEDKNTVIEELKQTVEEQGVKIVELSKVTGDAKKDTLENVFKKKYDEHVEKTNYTVPQTGFKIDTSKVTISTDVMSVNTINSTDFPAAGSTGVVSSGLQTLFGKLIGYFGYRKPSSKILDLVDVMPLDSATLIAINETVIGDAAITTECKLKPIVKATYAIEEKSADPVAVEWATTTKLRRFFPNLVNRMLKKFAELVNDKLPNVVLAAVKAGATAFTPNAALAINTNPNNYDALGAVIATLENLGFTPNAIILNPIAWRNMKQEKNDDGIYTLSNGNSVSIVQNGLDWGGNFIPYIKDTEMGVDEFIIGDLEETVKVGVDSELLYFETDGRTDAAATPASGLSRNIRTHVLEKFFAVIIPSSTKVGLIKDTFTNVKTLITAA